MADVTEPDQNPVDEPQEDTSTDEEQQLTDPLADDANAPSEEVGNQLGAEDTDEDEKWDGSRTP